MAISISSFILDVAWKSPVWCKFDQSQASTCSQDFLDTHRLRVEIKAHDLQQLLTFIDDVTTCNLRNTAV